MKPVHWMLLGVLTVGVYAATMTRTTFLIMAATLVLAFVLENSPKLLKKIALHWWNCNNGGGNFIFCLCGIYFGLV